MSLSQSAFCSAGHTQPHVRASSQPQIIPGPSIGVSSPLVDALSHSEFHLRCTSSPVSPAPPTLLSAALNYEHRVFRDMCKRKDAHVERRLAVAGISPSGIVVSSGQECMRTKLVLTNALRPAHVSEIRRTHANAITHPSVTHLNPPSERRRLL